MQHAAQAADQVVAANAALEQVVAQPTEQVVVASVAVQPVVTFLAQHHIVARAGVDLVVARELWRCRCGARGQRACVVVVVVDQRVAHWAQVHQWEERGVEDPRVHCDEGLVTEDQVAAVARIEHHVAACRADDQVVARTRVDGVVAAIGHLNRRDEPDREAPHRPRAGAIRVGGLEARAVTQHDVLAVAGIDRVAEAAADDDVVATRSCDGVFTTEAGGGKARDGVDVSRVQVGAARGRRTFQAHEVNQTIVAEDDVAARTRVDGVVAEAADDEFSSSAADDTVVAAVAKLDALDQADSHQVAGPARAIQVRGSDAAAVADDDVAIGGGVGRGCKDTAAARIDDVTEAPADHDVVASAACDGVGTTIGGGRRTFDQVNI